MLRRPILANNDDWSSNGVRQKVHGYEYDSDHSHPKRCRLSHSAPCGGSSTACNQNCVYAREAMELT